MYIDKLIDCLNCCGKVISICEKLACKNNGLSRWMGVYILAKMGKKCTEEIGNCYTEYGPGTNSMPQKCLSLCLVRVGWGCLFR